VARPGTRGGGYGQGVRGEGGKSVPRQACNGGGDEIARQVEAVSVCAREGESEGAACADSETNERESRHESRESSALPRSFGSSHADTPTDVDTRV
jgi:hypothetical protein